MTLHKTRERERRALPVTQPTVETDVATLLRNILTELRELRKVTITPPRGVPDAGHPPVHVVRVRVNEVGVPRQGPDMPVPPGYETSIRVRLHPTASPLGYVAFSRTDIGNTTSRIEMSEGLSIAVDIANWNLVWFDADTANTDFEMVVEMLRVPE